MMRNIPFPFLMEQTQASIAERAKKVRNLYSVRSDRHTIASRWPEIAEHKWFLSERLGRDVGTQVAALDYSENIARIAEPRRQGVGERTRAFLSNALNRLERALASEAATNLASVQYVMRGGAQPLKWRRTTEFKANDSPVGDLRVPADRLALHATAIEEHKWLLSERLGRDIGSRVAAVDYLQNIHPGKVQSWRESLAGLFDSLLEPSGPNSITNLERALGPRPPAVHSSYGR